MSSESKKKTKIAYVLTPISFGGAERVSLNFLKNFDTSQFTIEPILFLRPWERENYFESELKELGLKYFIIPISKSDRFDLFRIPRCFLMLLQLIRNKSYDLIHTHGYIADLMGIFVSKICTIPIISTCHGFIYEGKKLYVYNTLDCYCLKYFNGIISVSEQLKSDLITKGINKAKITVIENSPALKISDDNLTEIRNKLRNDIKIEPQELLIGYIGRLSSEKGILYLLESITMLDNLFKLVVIGEGGQEEELKKMVADRGLSSRVIFTGFQKNISEWLAAIDIFVLPSLTEGTPLVLLESMAHGVPCIATAVGGVPKIIESGIDGILVTPGKPMEIRDAVNELGSNTIIKNSISLNGKLKIEQNYNIRNWAAKTEAEYAITLSRIQIPSL